MVQLFTSTAFSVPVEAAERLERETPSSSPQDERTRSCCPIRQPSPYHLEATVLPPLLTDKTGSCSQERLFGVTGHAAYWLKAPRKLACLLLLSFLSLGSEVIFLCPVSTVNVEGHLQLLRTWGGGERQETCVSLQGVTGSCFC